MKSENRFVKIFLILNKELCLEKFPLVLLIIVLFSSLSIGEELDNIPTVYKPLKERLVQDGFDIEFLSKLFSDSRAEFNPSVLRIYINKIEEPSRYEKFLTEESIISAKKFLKQNLKILKKVERIYQVEKEVVVAILLVESRFGENIGKFRVITTLASIASLNSPENIKELYQNLSQQEQNLSVEEVESFAKRRSEWAYNELKCFLKIISENNIDPLEIYGSFAGAMGMAQFIPSSYLLYAKAKKGLVNWLLNKEEAILSIGNYLKAHGWKLGLPISKKRKLLWYYNNSEPYVDTILKIYKKIKFH